MVPRVRRLQLFEVHELPWLPAVWRDLVTDFLSFFFRTFNPYAAIAPVLAEVLDRASSRRIVDLCSGAGAPVLSLLPDLASLGSRPSSVTLTDLFPNRTAFRAAVDAGGGVVAVVEEPVDATNVPEGLTGFRTVFTSFHHFPPRQARQILDSASAAGEGIAIFEFTERNLWLWTMPVLLIPLLVGVCTPWIRPFSWTRMLWTCLVPVVPLVSMWDGLVSNLRTYSPTELGELVATIDAPRYSWRIGRVPSLGLSRVTYLVGWPEGS